MMCEVKREPRLRHLHAAELQATHGVPFADGRPSIASRRSAPARTSMEQVPDKAPAVARVFALNSDAEAPTQPAIARSGQDALSALMTASTISFEGWLVHSVT